jgi:hypothetical protein
VRREIRNKLRSDAREVYCALDMALDAAKYAIRTSP